MIRFLVSVAALGSVLLACATPPPPEGSSSSGLALYLDARAPLRVLPAKVGQVLFVRLDEGGEDALLGADIFYSNYSDDGYFYLLNPPPGRYAAVAAVDSSPGFGSPPPAPTYDVGKDGKLHQIPTVPSVQQRAYDRAIYFSEAFVRQTEVATRPGSLAFMGEFVVDTSILQSPDTLQAHYFRLLQPGESKNFLVQIVYEDAVIYSGDVVETDRSDAAHARFSHKASEHLTGAGWGKMLKGAGEGSSQ